MVYKRYEVRYSREVSDKIAEIYAHILKFTLSGQVAQKTSAAIILGLDKLEIFPEAGFNIDERVGKQLRPPYTTRGLIVGEYIAFYQVLDERNEAGEAIVLVSHLISAQSDWVNYFGR